MPNLSVVSITQPPADSTFVAQPGTQGMYIKEFPTGGAALTNFADSDNFADLIVGALPFSSAVEAAELVMLSGKRVRGDRVVTAENQTFRVQVFKGQAKHTLLFERMITRKDAIYRGQALGFLRTFPDDNAVQGVMYIENMVAEGDPSADAYGYDVEASFGDFQWVDVRVIPTFTSKTPSSGAVGSTITVTGTNLNVINAVQFRTGSTVNATQSTFGTKTPTSLAFNVPAGLTGAQTLYGMYTGGEVNFGSFTVS